VHGGDRAHPAIELLQRLLRFDADSPPGDEAACVGWCAELLTASGARAGEHWRIPDSAA